MKEPLLHPTPYPDINAVLHVFVSNVQAVLGDLFVGLYLYGSLACGDFDPLRSDVDFLVVTATEIPQTMLPALEAMHERIAAIGLKWARKLEGSYIPQAALRRYDPAHAHHPSYWSGRFGIDLHRSDWILHLHLLRERGIVVAGPHPQTLIDPIQPGDVQWAARASLLEWWSPMLEDSTRLQGSEYQVYAILTMCRMLYTLEHACLVSKPVAARWAQQILGQPWSALIDQALTWRAGQTFEKLEQTQDFIRYTIQSGCSPTLHKIKSSSSSP